MRQFVRLDTIYAAAIAGLLLGSALIIGMLAKANTQAANVYHPKGYIAKVQQLIASEVLNYERPQESNDYTGKILFDESRAKTAFPNQADFFIHSSRLQRDIRIFNSGNRNGTFHIRKGKLALYRNAHDVPLPYPKRNPVPGTILASATSQGVPGLANRQVQLYLYRQDHFQSYPTFRALGAAQWASQTGDNSFRSSSFRLLNRAQQPLLFMERRDGSVIVEVVQEHEAQIAINGIIVNRPNPQEVRELKARRPSLPVNQYELREGDRLRIGSKERDVIFRFGYFSPDTILQTRLRNGRRVHEINPEFKATFPMVSDILNGIEHYLQDPEHRKKVKSYELNLTIDRKLQSAIQDKLERYVKNYDLQTPGLPSDIQARPAAIAVVDGSNGHVPVMASYPGPETLKKLKRLSESGALSVSEGHLKRLSRNQNLQRVVIGSTTKPLLAAAIWDTRPDLRRLVVPQKSGSLITNVYGYPLKPALKNTAGVTSWNPINFIAQSSNPYMVSLYFAALAQPGTYRLDGAGMLRGRPDFAPYLNPNGTVTPQFHRAQLPVHQKLAQLFDIDLLEDYSASDEFKYQGQFLSPLFRQLGFDEIGAVPQPFWTVCPEKTNLQLNEINQTRTQLVSFLVGGYSNRWSNVKLAEAYARLGSGRKVFARLARDTIEQERPVRLPLIMLSDEVRSQVMTGMKAAIDTGTARALKPALDKINQRGRSRNYAFRAYGKTGTAARISGRECSAFVLYLDLIDLSTNQSKASCATSIYLEDRAVRGNSGNAVRMAGDILPDLASYLELKANFVRD